MTMLSNEVKKCFPLQSIADVVEFFRKQIESHSNPDLTLLSIVAGFIENTLTSRYSTDCATDVMMLSSFPVISYENVEALYKKFQANLSTVSATTTKGKSKHHGLLATREIIKKISDLIWNSLIRAKDRAHLQSLYSYLSGNKLDCFGVAFAVVAGCQVLGYNDVHLAVSEDHVWVVFGQNGRESMEVTWHGKGFEDKRDQPISVGIESQSWLYLCGHPVVCDRQLEVVALILAINPSLNISSACLEVTDLQQQLLWLMYDNGNLSKYPMALGTLGEFEEVSPTENRPNCESLYTKAISSARRLYKNYHVYPYTYQGGYYYRSNLYKQALTSWANAGDVIRHYVYSRDDKEIYKELLEIANELIPQIMKTESSGHSAKSILRDSNCFANLLRFYDGICKFEEGSLTPIFHIGWAKPLVSTIAKFDYDIRSQVLITSAGDDEELPQYKYEEEKEENDIEYNNNLSKANNNNNDESSKLPQALADLTAKCGEKILNPHFLLQGDGQPFTTEQENDVLTPIKVEFQRDEAKTTFSAETNQENTQKDLNDHVFERKQPEIKLYSQKMKGLKDLLLAEKLNTQAISLQMTAQSQVKGRKLRNTNIGNVDDRDMNSVDKTASSAIVGLGNESESNSRPKRSRRD